jgi:hypothetical protein
LVPLPVVQCLSCLCVVRTALCVLSARSRCVRWRSVCTDVRVQHVIRVLESLHMHRVVVTDSHGRPTGVVSLRDVLSVLVVEPRDYFGDYFD